MTTTSENKSSSYKPSWNFSGDAIKNFITNAFIPNTSNASRNTTKELSVPILSKRPWTDGASMKEKPDAGKLDDQKNSSTRDTNKLPTSLVSGEVVGFGIQVRPTSNIKNNKENGLDKEIYRYVHVTNEEQEGNADYNKSVDEKSRGLDQKQLSEEPLIGGNPSYRFLVSKEESNTKKKHSKKSSKKKSPKINNKTDSLNFGSNKEKIESPSTINIAAGGKTDLLSHKRQNLNGEKEDNHQVSKDAVGNKNKDNKKNDNRRKVGPSRASIALRKTHI